MAKEWKFLPVRPSYQAKVDAEDYDRLMKHTWRVITKPSGRKKVVTNIVDSEGKNRQISLGQFLMSPPPGKMVYPRRFMEGFDYRKENLIVCTMAERQKILPKSRRHGTSRFKGVSFITSKKQWRAAIKVNKKSITLGHFKTEEDAALAYNKAAREHFGDQAYQNRVEKKLNRKND
jgi:AP2-like factor, euAP2 lineage